MLTLESILAIKHEFENNVPDMLQSSWLRVSLSQMFNLLAE